MTRVIETEPCGLLFDFDRPLTCQVNIHDIARALSNSCRFGGLVTRFYSVAQHAMMVHQIVKDAGESPAVCYAALHHDSHEAYLGDVVTPLKKKLGPAWVELQEAVDAAISDALEIDFDLMHHPAVKAADAKALLIEAAVLKSSRGVGPQWRNSTVQHGPRVTDMPPSWAETRFLIAHANARAAVVGP